MNTEPPQPFGSNLFMGNFLRAREDGLNPDYVVMPGDRVAVSTWGAIEMNRVEVVDGQGNLFVPEIGPVPLAGVRAADLTTVVQKHIERVYLRHFGVYTNLLTAKPVAIFVTGGVPRPGRYAGVPSDSVLFFLDQAGGIDSRFGSYRNVQILREGAAVLEIDLYDFILEGKLGTHQFKDGDTVLVGKRGAVVQLQGDVANAALVELKGQSATGADALAIVPKTARANGVTFSGVRAGQPFQHSLTAREFERSELRDGDVITLRDELRADTVMLHLEGEIDGPSVLTVARGSRLLDVLNYVQVRPELADTTAVHLRRTSVAKAQKDSINDSLFRLERSALLALSGTHGEADIRVKEADLMQKFAERARLIDPLGRVVTSVGGKQVNVLLEDGDTLVIPRHSQVVRVGGEVQMSHAVLHRREMTAQEYIDLAGGYSDRADHDKVIILHADASVEVVDPSAEIWPGDEILVPPRVDTKLTQNIMDLTQIIYQIAVSAAVIVPLM